MLEEMLKNLNIQNHDTIKSALKTVINNYRTNYHTTARNEKDFSLYKGKPFPSEVMMNKTFQQITNYGYDLFRSISPREYDIEKPIPDEVVKEALHWEQDGSMCIQISVLLYTLLLETKVFTPTSLQLVQGYFHHMTDENASPYAFTLGKEHLSMHAWLVSRGSVIDMTIGQEMDFYDFTDENGRAYPFFIGEVKDSMTLMGKTETKKIVSAYIKDYAKHLGITKEEWIKRQLFHFNQYREA